MRLWRGWLFVNPKQLPNDTQTLQTQQQEQQEQQQQQEQQEQLPTPEEQSLNQNNVSDNVSSNLTTNIPNSDINGTVATLESKVLSNTNGAANNSTANSGTELLKTPITLEQVKHFISQVRTRFKTRSVPGLIIAAYDFLKLWSLPGRYQKMVQLMQASQMNGNVGFPVQPNQQYNTQQNQSFQQYQQNQMYNQQKNYPVQQHPNSHNFNMNRAGQTYTVSRGRGRGRPPKNGQGRTTFPGPQAQMPERVIQVKTKEQKERALAQIFLYRGYGIGFAKAEVTFPMDANIYYTYMRTILFRAFAKLEAIVASECRMQVTPSEDYKLIKFKSQLCKCERWMQRTELKTYQEYIRSVYDLNPQAVSKGDTIRLYRLILNHWEQVKANVYRNQDNMPNQGND